jgi:hypothetical protein
MQKQCQRASAMLPIVVGFACSVQVSEDEAIDVSAQLTTQIAQTHARTCRKHWLVMIMLQHNALHCTAARGKAYRLEFALNRIKLHIIALSACNKKEKSTPATMGEATVTSILACCSAHLSTGARLPLLQKAAVSAAADACVHKCFLISPILDPKRIAAAPCCDSTCLQCAAP